jgi:hypothetical protein
MICKNIKPDKDGMVICPEIHKLTGYTHSLHIRDCQNCTEESIMKLARMQLRVLAKAKRWDARRPIDDIIKKTHKLFGEDVAKEHMMAAAQTGQHKPDDLVKIAKDLNLE